MKWDRRHGFGFVLLCCLITMFLFGCASRKAKVPLSAPMSFQGSPLYGRPDAPVKIIEFTDFECHFCGQVQPALLQILKTYPDEVSLTFKNFPLAMHRHAQGAHLAAMCADEQGKFWEYRNHLFEHQNALKRNDLIQHASQLGLNVEAFTQCLDQEKYASKIEQDFQEGLRLGVAGTPTFFINGMMLSGAHRFATFDRLVQDILRERIQGGSK